MAIKFRRGQALMELALGMFALALVASGLFAFSEYIISSLEMHRHLRAEAGIGALNGFGGDESYSSRADSDTVHVEQFAADYIFNSPDVEIHEEVHIPMMSGLGNR